MFEYFLGLGSNIEPRQEYLGKAIDVLNTMGKIIKKSAIYESDAWGNENQKSFLNAVLEFHSEKPPLELLKLIKNAESEIGRKNHQHWGPREVDIDILFCRGMRIETEELKIPHPEFSVRRFVLLPMAELEQTYPVEGANKTIAEFLNQTTDAGNVHKLTGSW